MKLEDLTAAIVRQYGLITDQGIMLGVLTGRDVCVSSKGPFACELVGPEESPTFHGEQEYVRYAIFRSSYDQHGRLVRK